MSVNVKVYIFEIILKEWGNSTFLCISSFAEKMRILFIENVLFTEITYTCIQFIRILH